MNYLKLLTITLLLIPGFVILSIDTTYATESIVDIIHMAAFAIYIGMMYAIHKYTKLFKFDHPVSSGDIHPGLAAFLHKNKALEAFLYYTNKYNKQLRRKGERERDMKEVRISDAFGWDSTIQGFEYWAELNQRWCQECFDKGND